MGLWEDPFSSFLGGDGDGDGDVFAWSEAQMERAGDIDVDWEGLNISQWDNFPYCS